MLEGLFGGTVDEFADVGRGAFAWLSERDRARYEAQWRTEQARQAGAVAAAYGQASAAAAAVQARSSERTMVALLVMAGVLILFRIRPTAND